MKLEVSHNEIVKGLTAFLASQGIAGFDPATCQVTFKQARGTGELSAVLDTDPAPTAPVAPKEEATAKPTPAAEAGTSKPVEQVAEIPVETVTSDAAIVVEAEGGDDGLFS